MMRGALPTLALLLLFAPTASARAVTVHAGGDAQGGALYFRPAQLSADEGERITLTLVNDDPTTPHDWALLGYGGRDIEVYVRGDQSRTINFTARETGEFRIVCQVVGHKQRGMEGTFVVDDKLLVPGPPGLLAFSTLACAALLARRRA